MRSIKQKVLFCIVTGLLWFSQYAYNPVLEPYAESLGASYKFIGIILGSYGLIQMLIRIPLGILSDSLGKRKPVIIAGLLLSMLSGLGSWYFRTPISLLVFRIMAGAAASTWVVYTVQFAR